MLQLLKSHRVQNQSARVLFSCVDMQDWHTELGRWHIFTCFPETAKVQNETVFSSSQTVPWCVWTCLDPRSKFQVVFWAPDGLFHLRAAVNCNRNRQAFLQLIAECHRWCSFCFLQHMNHIKNCCFRICKIGHPCHPNTWRPSQAYPWHWSAGKAWDARWPRPARPARRQDWWGLGEVCCCYPLLVLQQKPFPQSKHTQTIW